LAVPFAGPPCFLDPELRHFNTSLRPPGIFPDSEQAVEWLREHLPGQAWACFRPGDRIDLATGAVTPDPVSARFSYTDGIDGYLDRYAADRAGAFARVHAAAGAPGPDLGDWFRRHFTRLGTLSPYFLTRIGMTVRFEVTGPHGGSWDVRMDADGLRVDLDGGATAPEYTFTLAGHWLGAVLNGQIAWEDLLLSLRLTARRDPDRYNDYLIGLLKHANAPALAAIEAYETGRDTDERIVVRAGEQAYEIGRYCPHAGEDLAIGAIVEGRTLRCLGHNFEFDLATGECRNGRNSAGPGLLSRTASARASNGSPDESQGRETHHDVQAAPGGARRHAGRGVAAGEVSRRMGAFAGSSRSSSSGGDKQVGERLGDHRHVGLQPFLQRGGRQVGEKAGAVLAAVQQRSPQRVVTQARVEQSIHLALVLLPPGPHVHCRGAFVARDVHIGGQRRLGVGGATGVAARVCQRLAGLQPDLLVPAP